MDPWHNRKKNKRLIKANAVRRRRRRRGGGKFIQGLTP